MLEIRHSEDNVAMDNMDDAIQRSGMSYKFIVSAMNNLHSHCHTNIHETPFLRCSLVICPCQYINPSISLNIAQI